MAKEPKSTLPRKDRRELENIAQGIVTNAIFTDRHIAPGDARMASMVFAPLGFLDRKQLFELQRKMRPGMIYAHWEKAGPRAINGYPMFFECHMLHPEDADIVWDLFQQLNKNLTGHDVQPKQTRPVSSLE